MITRRISRTPKPTTESAALAAEGVYCRGRGGVDLGAGGGLWITAAGGRDAGRLSSGSKEEGAAERNPWSARAVDDLRPAEGGQPAGRPPGVNKDSAALAAERAFCRGWAVGVVDLGAGVRVFLALAVVRLLAFQCRSERGLHILLRCLWLGLGGCGFRCVRHGVRVARSGRPSRVGLDRLTGSAARTRAPCPAATRRGPACANAARTVCVSTP